MRPAPRCLGRAQLVRCNHRRVRPHPWHRSRLLHGRQYLDRARLLSGTTRLPGAFIAAGPSHLVQLPSGQHMFLRCSGDQGAIPTVILATGRGLGTADAWAKVQERISPTIRVCSYDALGAGHSDHLSNDAPPQRRPVDKVISDAHTFLETARLKQPYILVGASDGGILLRRYQEAYPHKIAGLVFVDSAHEEQEWRMATISDQLDPNWNDPAFQWENGYLPDHQKLAWHADIPLIVLERTEKDPASIFPMLSSQQLNALNAEWHDHQVNLAKRSRYGQLRAVTDSGHFMHQQRPDAVAEAIQDVVQQVRAKLDESRRGSVLTSRILVSNEFVGATRDRVAGPTSHSGVYRY